MNWRSFFWWLVFSAGWALLLIGIVRRWPALCIFAGGLLGFLTLCAVDIFQAWRHQQSLRTEYRKRFEARDQS